MSSFRITFIFLASLLGGQALMAQQAYYPSTQYAPFGTPQTSDGFSTASPMIPDTMLPGTDDHQAMSPSSWSEPPANTFGTNGSMFQNTNASAPFVPGQVTTGQARRNQFPLATQSSGASVMEFNSQEVGGSLASPFKSAGFSPSLNAPVRPILSAPIQEPGSQPNRYPLFGNGSNVDQNEAQVLGSLELPFPKNAQPLSAQTFSQSNMPPQQWQTAGAMPVWSNGQSLPTYYHEQPIGSAGTVYRPDLGHRDAVPTRRHFGWQDNGEQFDFENKKTEYPPMSEILATGRYFASSAIMYSRPHFQNNTAFSTSSATFGESIAFDFDYESAPFVRFGFESKYGPGIEFDYLQYDESSNPASFTATAGVTAELSTWMIGPGRWSRIGALNAGETLSAEHSIDVETFGVSFFKEVQLPISRINGRFGMQYVSIAQNMDATLTDSGGGVVGTLNSRSDMRAYGPKFTLEYYRPVGHTKLEFVTTVGGAVMFGKRDQFVANTLAADFSRVGADEFLTSVEFNSGLQYKHNIAEKRSVYARLGVNYSTWMGGGSAVDPQGNFGLRGFSMAVGYNR